ncbi:class I SAM-dependent methyltransferase [Paracoccus sp. IB05]|uniref:class I SAM-dependent methyltransferase n=1 Tax=Paracoccus sp. IB05 TaxID=2779367 RepID=UPI0018E84D34|nr:class I SAM-dependent methyltransferase [Paracoccus sp. IB05]MBJ2151021.1 class I SAM-dependent methyltransferase [Paracoccus sp. IB05]
MKECSKSVARRLSDSRFVRKYFRGNGVDIGGAPDPLALYTEFFPLMTSVRTWDLNDGDAQFMAGVADDSFDFVFSSHCLEHLNDPLEGLQNWVRVTKPGGYVIFALPEEDLYEQGIFPSSFNRDHKNTFTMKKERSWSPRSINMLEMLCKLGPDAAVEKVELLDETYRYALPRYDQTMTPVGESGIEVVIRKRSSAELEAAARVREAAQPSPEVRLHLNQYRDDQKTLRAANPANPPFLNDSEI